MIKIAYLGIPGSYSYLAVRNFLGKTKFTMKNKSTFEDVFLSVKSNEADYAAVPLENSLTGSIIECYDFLLKTNIKIVGEIILKINHHLVANIKFKRKNFHDKKFSLTCLTQQEVLKQCRCFFMKNKHISPILINDTANAAKTVSESIKVDEVAISSKEAAKIYNLQILSKNIADFDINFTRFVILAKHQLKSGNKVSLMFSVKHIPGSLVQAIGSYAKFGLNLMKIESRQISGKPWEYIFYLDFDITNKSRRLESVIKDMKKNTEFIKILGIYQKGEIYET